MAANKRRIANWINHLIYGLLIFCLGGVGPLTYFDAFSPHHNHPFHLSLFGGAPDHHQEVHCPGLDEQQHHQQQPAGSWQLKAMGESGTAYTANQQTLPGFARFFQSGLSYGFLLTGTELDIDPASSLSYRIPAASLTDRSIGLPPPEKPPSHLSHTFSVANL
ncbi:MAG TPA: hypothetical protein VGD99_10095 [Anaerolineae bacterium]|jgi:hypothetical protein